MLIEHLAAGRIDDGADAGIQADAAGHDGDRSAWGMSRIKL
jgi:hypothetical protein